MVITTSDSCSTLVGLEQHQDKKSGLALPHMPVLFTTKLLVPSGKQLCLPSSSSLPVDICIAEQVPSLVKRSKDILSREPQYLCDQQDEEILYVAQGEIAHCSNSATANIDVLASDKATTCHILAVRSSSSCGSLTSLAHIDDDRYEQSIRDLCAEHSKYHSKGKASMSIHILGGFCDDQGYSIKISEWLIRLLAQLAEEYSGILDMTLETCAVTSMNHSPLEDAPIGRGLAINCHTGHVFLCKISHELIPLMALRSARLWSKDPHRELSIIYQTKHQQLCIEPFSYQSYPEIDRLLQLEDHTLLHFTSTSPDVEEVEFCASLRDTLIWLRDVPSEAVFGRGAISLKRQSKGRWTMV